jgi:hypothetical protein
MKTYYRVYLSGDHAPAVRHDTLASALTESERLALKHPGSSFEILKLVGISRIHKPACTFFVDGEGAATDAGKGCVE